MRFSERLHRFFAKPLILLIVISFFSVAAWGVERPEFDPEARFHPVYAEHGMVVSAEAHATRAGLQVLKEGGNAVDAAVTVGFTLAVTYPMAGNIGGGGFMLIYMADKKEVTAIDYREKAPMAVKADMYLDDKWNPDKEKSRHSILAVGVPGTVTGLTLALEKFGTITLQRAMQPAIELAENGYPVSEELRRSLLEAKDRMEMSEASMAVFFKDNGEPYATGELLKQKDLARSLREISENGPDAFYKGDIANKMAGFMKENGGLITKEDLESYKPVVREPVRGTYRGYEIYSMPPPSSGGVHLVQMLNILELFPLGSYGHNTAKTIHTMAETMKLAYADRSVHLGDPDFVYVPVTRLTSKNYAKELKEKIDPAVATPSEKVKPGEMSTKEGENTTHYSVADRYGNAVSNTYTLNFRYGSKMTVPGTGILLNNEMDDFSMKPGLPNAHGLTGGEYNAVAPGKRMLSSMTPTIVLGNGKLFLITGSPGGSQIITTVLQIITNVIDFGMNIAEATNAVRVHHQWLPDELRIEEGLSGDTITILGNMGYKCITGNTMGSAQSIMKVGGLLYGANDPRRPGGLAEGY